MPNLTHRPLTRRAVMRAGALAAGGIAVGATSVACTTSDGGDQAPPGGTRDVEQIDLPTYQQFAGVAPDFPASVEGGVEGFLSYPRDAGEPLPPPGGGISASALIALGGKPQVPLADSTYWQQLNTNLDCELDVQSIPPGQFTAKVSTVIAGGDIPDIMEIPGNLPMDLPRLLDSTFEDLTPYVTGDAVGDYPYLANFPQTAWRSCVYNGKIYGIPSVSRLLQRFMVVRSDLVERHGWNDRPADATEMVELFTAMAAVGRDSFAGTASQLFALCLPMFGAPNGWRATDDSFVFNIETEEYKEALACVTQLWADGICHPNSFLTEQQIVDWFGTGAIATYAGAGVGYRGMLTAYHTINPEMEMGFVPIPRAEGGGPAPAYVTSGRNTMAVIRKSDPERVAKLLGIANYMAAPFGTPEYLFLNYGAEGEHFNWDDEAGLPVRTKKGDTEYMGNLVYIARPPTVLFFPGYDEVTEADWANEKVVIADQVPPGDLGLYSPTQTTKGPGLLRDVTNRQWDVIQGRATMDDWDATVQRWRDGGGDQMREELIAAREADQ
ncbi:extracellular solute-binding protein [Microlunatus sp. Y2014]|uniref:extracellular solute-binding protein n=1 Tax=Microlunatus sp. Y2014 TaxID=3418488 RepID=UPI003DA77BBB